MSTVSLGRLYRFNAGHRLSRPDRAPDWNLEVFGKCSYEGGHGHNYDLEVVISGAPDPLTGRIISLELLDTIVNEKVIEPIDHRNLNEVLETGSTPPPTTEILIKDIWNRLAKSIPSPAELELLRILETEKNLFEYSGPA